MVATLRAALIQIPAGHDREANLERGLEAFEEAARQGARLVLFPELAFLRFFPQRRGDRDARSLAEPVPGPTVARFAERARELGVVVVLNLYERAGERYYDSSPVLDADGSLLGVARMVQIADFDGFHEREYYDPGDRGACVFDTAVGRIGIAICYDRHYPEHMRALALDGAEVVVIPQAGAEGEWPEGMFEAEVRAAAFQNGYFALLANRVGPEEAVRFAGESFAVDPEGRVLARAPMGKEHVLLVDLELDLVGRSTARRLFLRDRRADAYAPRS